MTTINVTNLPTIQLPWLARIADQLFDLYLEQQIACGDLSAIDPDTKQPAGASRFSDASGGVRINWPHIAIGIGYWNEDLGRPQECSVVLDFTNGHAYLSDGWCRFGVVLQLTAIAPEIKK